MWNINGVFARTTPNTVFFSALMVQNREFFIIFAEEAAPHIFCAVHGAASIFLPVHTRFYLFS